MSSPSLHTQVFTRRLCAASVVSEGSEEVQRAVQIIAQLLGVLRSLKTKHIKRSCAPNVNKQEMQL